MSFASRQLPESIRHREIAAEERFFDGLSLYCDERRTAAIYLLGYCAEILVKNAYYRYRGVPEARTVGNVRSMLLALGATINGNSHDLEAWGKLLIKERKITSSPLNPVFAGALLVHLAKVRAHWRETLRYSCIAANQKEAAEVYTSVEWIKINYPLLWS